VGNQTGISHTKSKEKKND